MLATHIASFLKLISAQLDEKSRGIASPHHFHPPGLWLCLSLGHRPDGRGSPLHGPGVGL